MLSPCHIERGASSISAVLPNFNHGHVIGNAVAALLGQSMPPTEIIIVDDASTDDSLDIVEDLAATDARIKVICHKQNQGAIAAINSGIAVASGAFVYLGAADDVTLPSIFQTLHAALVRHSDAAFACGETLRVDTTKGKTSSRPAARPSMRTEFFAPAATEQLFKRIDNFILTGAALIRHRCLIDAGGLRPDLESFADGFLMRQLAFRHGFVFVPRILAEWRVSPSGLSYRTSTDVEKTIELQQVAANAFAEDKAFPVDYWPCFRERWKFSALRLALLSESLCEPMFSSFAPGPRVARPLFVKLTALGRIGRGLALAWAAIWYRPFALTSVIITAATRAIERRQGFIDES